MPPQSETPIFHAWLRNGAPGSTTAATVANRVIFGRLNPTNPTTNADRDDLARALGSFRALRSLGRIADDGAAIKSTVGQTRAAPPARRSPPVPGRCDGCGQPADQIVQTDLRSGRKRTTVWHRACFARRYPRQARLLKGAGR